MIAPFILLAAASAPAPKASALPLPPVVPSALTNFSFTPKSAIAEHFPWLTHTLAGIGIVAAFALIVLLAVQTTKQEGLSGTIGGRVESAYRPRLGFDQQLVRVTSGVAVVFAFVALLLGITGI